MAKHGGEKERKKKEGESFEAYLHEHNISNTYTHTTRCQSLSSSSIDFLSPPPPPPTFLFLCFFLFCITLSTGRSITQHDRSAVYRQKNKLPAGGGDAQGRDLQSISPCLSAEAGGHRGPSVGATQARQPAASRRAAVTPAAAAEGENFASDPQFCFTRVKRIFG